VTPESPTASPRHHLPFTLALQCRHPAQAFLFGRVLSIKELTDTSDLFLKATALSSTPITDDEFTPISGFLAYNTKFKVITVLKGEAPAEVGFHHYGKGGPPGHMFYWPESFNFKPGRTYLLWAKKTPDGVLRQFGMATATHGQIAVLTRDAAPVIGIVARDIVWNELNFSWKATIRPT